MMFPMSDGQFQLVYNILSFSLASMMATTLFLWMRVPAINAKYRTALIISGLVTFIAAYHYMDWLLTVPMLLMEIVLVMNLSGEQASQKCLTLGVSSALMIILGYPGELIINGDLSMRWKFWGLAMLPFCYIVFELLVGLATARNSEANDSVRALIFRAQWVTVVSWLTYPVVYVFPMLGFSGGGAVVAIQVGYCCSDIISKCGVGLIIYSITARKSQLEKDGALLSSSQLERSQRNHTGCRVS